MRLPAFALRMGQKMLLSHPELYAASVHLLALCIPSVALLMYLAALLLPTDLERAESAISITELLIVVGLVGSGVVWTGRIINFRGALGFRSGTQGALEHALHAAILCAFAGLPFIFAFVLDFRHPPRHDFDSEASFFIRVMHERWLLAGAYTQIPLFAWTGASLLALVRASSASRVGGAIGVAYLSAIPIAILGELTDGATMALTAIVAYLAIAATFAYGARYWPSTFLTIFSATVSVLVAPFIPLIAYSSQVSTALPPTIVYVLGIGLGVVSSPFVHRGLNRIAAYPR